MHVGILDRFDWTSDDWMWLKIKDPWNPRGYQPDSPVVADWVTRPTNQVTGPTDQLIDYRYSYDLSHPTTSMSNTTHMIVRPPMNMK